MEQEVKMIPEDFPNSKGLEESLENGITSLSLSKSNCGDCKETSLELENLKLNCLPSARRLNKKLSNSSDLTAPEISGCLNSSSEPTETSISSEQDIENIEDKDSPKLRNGTGFRLRIKSFHGYDRWLNFSNRLRQASAPPKHLPVSIRTRSSKVLNLADSSKTAESDDSLTQSPAASKHDLKNGGDKASEEIGNSIGFRLKSRLVRLYRRGFSLGDEQRHSHSKELTVCVETHSGKASNSGNSLKEAENDDTIEVFPTGFDAREKDDSFLASDNIKPPFLISQQKDGEIGCREKGSKMEHKAKEEGTNDGIGFRLRTRSLNAFDRSSTSSNKKQQGHSSRNHLPVPRGTRSSNALNSSFSSHSKDAEQTVNFSFSEKVDEKKILEKVDELKSELHRMFSRKVDGKEPSHLSIKMASVEGNAASNENRSPLTPFSRQSSSVSSCSTRHSAGTGHLSGSRRSSQEAQMHHCRPVSGGAPFVICYKCYILLQLPADFLVSTKRIHKLRCGSCSEVLGYSFRPRPRMCSARDNHGV